MQRLSRDRHVYELNAAQAPAYTVADGETFLVETHDCHAGCFTRRGTWLGTRPSANPATGPIAVTGSQPGEALAVTIEKVEAADWGFIAGGEEGAPFTVIEMHDGRACYPWGLSLPLDPMVGVLGVAPEGAPVDTATPSDWGGNLDTREVRAGSTIYFPVAAPGALLVVGDVHALQGDGECCGTGIECAAEITLTVHRVPEPLWPCPLLTHGNLLMLVATADTLDEAAWRAVSEMSGLISKLTGLPNVQARRLLSTAGDIHISQIVNPRKTCRAVISREALGGAWLD